MGRKFEQKNVLIMSLPFVHTARRYYRLNGLVRILDWNSLVQQWTREQEKQNESIMAYI